MSRIKNNDAMIREIAQEEAIFRHILQKREHYTADFVALLAERSLQKAYLIGSGSPHHLSSTLRLAAIALLGIEAQAPLPSPFLHHEGFDPAGEQDPSRLLLICPVESGKTTGPIEAARRAKALGIPVVSTTLNPDGQLASLSDVVLHKPSGREMAPPTTKGHATGLLLLLLCFLEAGRAKGHLSSDTYHGYLAALEALPDKVTSNLARTRSWFAAHSQRILAAPAYWFLTYGGNGGTGADAVLKFLETHQKPSFSYDLEEFLHGPLCAVGPRDLVFFLAAEAGPQRDRMLQLYRTMQPSYPNLVLMTDEGMPDLPDPAWILPLDSCGLPFVNALEFLVPIQVLAYEIADGLGKDVTLWTTTAIRQIMKPSIDE